MTRIGPPDYLALVLDIRRIRAEPEAVRQALARRRDPGVVADLDRVIELDRRQRELAGRRDGLRGRIRQLSREVGALRAEDRLDEAQAQQVESRALGEEEKALDTEYEAIAVEVRDLLLGIPNTPAPETPDGTDDSDNVVLRVEGYDPEAYGPHQRVPHWNIGAELGILDFERAVKISGSMFAMYRGWGARLLRGLVQLALDRNVDAYEEIRPPTLVLSDTMVSTGHLPKFADDAYHVERDDLWAIPTAEVPLTSLGRDEIVDESALPMRFMAYTTCYRREAGSAGRDTRGLLRVHEFDKVELLAYATTTEEAIACQEDVLARSESLLRELGLAYRVVDLCAADLSGSAARTWDLEAYAPGVDQWLEVSSVSWFSDYQGRRANIRYRPGGARGTEVCHTVNGSCLGWPRAVAALLETHRQPDGSILLPEVVRPYVGGADRIPPPPAA